MRGHEISFRSIKIGISRIFWFHDVSGQFARSRSQSGTGSGRKWDRKWGPKGSAETWAWASESLIGSAPRKSRDSRHPGAIRTVEGSILPSTRMAGGAGDSCMSVVGVAWNWDWVAAAICSLLPRAPRRRLCARCWRVEKTQRPPVPKRKCAQIAAQIQRTSGMVTSRERISSNQPAAACRRTLQVFKLRTERRAVEPATAQGRGYHATSPRNLALPQNHWRL